MPLQINAELELSSEACLSCCVTNTSGRKIHVRELDLRVDLLIQTADGVSAVPAFTSSFGSLTRRRVLEQGESFRDEWKLLELFLFPVAGTYRVELVYDSKRRTFLFDDCEDLDAVVAFAPSVSLEIPEQLVKIPAEPDPASVAAARAYLMRSRNKRWWQFWRV